MVGFNMPCRIRALYRPFHFPAAGFIIFQGKMRAFIRHNKIVNQGSIQRKAAVFKAPVLNKFTIQTTISAMTNFLKKYSMQVGRNSSSFRCHIYCNSSSILAIALQRNQKNE